MAEVGQAGVLGRGPLPDDGHRDGLEPALHASAGWTSTGGGPTYTVDTLRDLREERGDDVDLFFITGADALAQILTWRDVQTLFDLAHFVGCTRPGVELHSPAIAELPPERITLMEVPALAISSTGCRERVTARQPIWYLVPDGIVQYIAKRGLYLP